MAWNHKINGSKVFEVQQKIFIKFILKNTFNFSTRQDFLNEQSEVQIGKRNALSDSLDNFPKEEDNIS